MTAGVSRGAIHPQPRLSAGTAVKVWDPVVRIFHWTLVASFTFAYLSGEAWEWLHVNSGYLVAILVMVRTVWGFVGTRHARFSDFVRRPSVVRSYLGDLLRLRQRHYLGHNPAGGLMIVTLLVLLALTAMSGMALYGVDPGKGPLAGLAGLGAGFWIEVLEGLHELSANATVVMIVVHIGGVIVESLLSGENLIRAMWDGYKRDANPAQQRL